MRALNKSIVRTLGLAASALLLAGCGGGSDGGFTGQEPIKLEIFADFTSFPVNTTPVIHGDPSTWPSLSGPYTNSMTVQLNQNGNLFPAEDVTVDISGGPNGSGALYYLDGDSDHEECEDFDGVELCVPLAFRRLAFEDTSGIVTFHFHAGTVSGKVNIVASANDPNTGQRYSATLTLDVGSGAATGLPATIQFDLTETPDLYIQGLGRQDVGIFEFQVLDDANEPVSGPSGVNNVRLEILSNSPGGGERLAASGATGNQTGQQVSTFTRQGAGQVSLRSGSLPGIVTVRATADREDNDVDDGIQDPVIAVFNAIIGSGKVKSLTFTGPFAGAVTNYGNFLELGDGDFIGDGVYNRRLSIIGVDEFGNPPVVGTPVSLRLIDSPATGYPDEGRGVFSITGTDGNIAEGGNLFTTLTPIPTTSNPPCPVVNGVLVYDGAPPYQSGGKIITGFNPPSTLSTNTAFPKTANTGFTVPYVVGCVPHSGNVDTTVFLDGNGVGSFSMRYPVNQLGRNFILAAEADGGQAGAVMRHWYLGQSRNVTLTVDPTEIILGGLEQREVTVDVELPDGSGTATRTTSFLVASGSQTVRLFLVDGGGEPLPAELIDVKIVVNNPAVEGFAEAQDALTEAQAELDACLGSTGEDDGMGGTLPPDCSSQQADYNAALLELASILAQLELGEVTVSPEVIRTGANGVVDVLLEFEDFPAGSTATLAFATVGPTPNEANPVISNSAIVNVTTPGGDGEE